MDTIPLGFRQQIDEELAGVQVRPTVKGLLCNLLLDLPLSGPQADDFGITSALHYQALRAALDGAVEQEEGMAAYAQALDQAMGNGKQLTELVKRYAPDYEVTFTTVWDKLYGRT